MKIQVRIKNALVLLSMILRIQLVFFLLEDFLNLFDLPTNCAFEAQESNKNHDTLLKDHDNDQIHLEVLEILEEEDVEKVTNVRVYELEDVYFVDHRVLKTASIPMVLGLD